MQNVIFSKYSKSIKKKNDLPIHPLSIGFKSVHNPCIFSSSTVYSTIIPTLCLPSTGRLSNHLQIVESNFKWMDFLHNTPCLISLCSETHQNGLTDINLRILVAWIIEQKLYVKSIWIINNKITDMKPFADLITSKCLVSGFHLHLSKGEINPASIFIFLLNINIRFTIIRVDENNGVAYHLHRNSKLLNVTFHFEKQDIFTSDNNVIIGTDLRQNIGTWYRDIKNESMFEYQQNKNILGNNIFIHYKEAHKSKKKKSIKELIAHDSIEKKDSSLILIIDNDNISLKSLSTNASFE